MVDYVDGDVFNDTQRTPMEPCSEPTVEEFEYNQNTLIWVNIDGEMRLYSYNGAKIQYQVVQLGAKVDASPTGGEVLSYTLTDGGAWFPDGSFSATQSSTSGSGIGAEFTVTVSGGEIASIDSVTNGGSGYAVSDTITLDVTGGAGIGGNLTVDSVS